MSEGSAAEGALLLQRLVLAIVGAVNSSALYPPGHPRVRAAVDQLVEALESLLIARHQHAINLLMVDEDLVVDQQPFRHAGLHLRGFVNAMRQLGIEGLTLGRGLAADECAAFLGAITERSAAVSTEHIVVGRVRLAFDQPGGGDDGEAGGGAEPSGGDGRRRRPGGRELLTETQIETAREAFGRFRTDRKGSLALMEGLVWGFIDALAQGARLAFPLAPLRAHDELTYVHSVNVALLTLAHARALGFRGEPLKEIGLGALLHDIGKLGVPAAVLNKEGPLSEGEWAVVRRHPELGAARLCELDASTTVSALVAYEHHLRYDGVPSYPLLRTPRRATLASLLTSVSDTFDAIVTVRPYARPVSRAAALQIVRGRAGTFLDPLLVESFCRMCDVAPAAPLPGDQPPP